MSDLADSVGNWTINWFAYLCAILEPEVHYYEVKYWQKPWSWCFDLSAFLWVWRWWKDKNVVPCGPSVDQADLGLIEVHY